MATAHLLQTFSCNNSLLSLSLSLSCQFSSRCGGFWGPKLLSNCYRIVSGLVLKLEILSYPQRSKSHDKNQFCLSCCTGPHCIQGLSESHSGHASVQVRKASHRDVVRVADIKKYLDISNIQLYPINGAKIVFLQSRPQTKSCKGAPKYCDTCHRSLADQVRFCSINCKRVAVCDASVRDLELTLSHSIDSVSDGTDSMNLEATNFSPSTPNRHGNHTELNNLSLKMPPFKRQKISEDRSHSLSPMSVLGAGVAFRFDCLRFTAPPRPSDTVNLVQECTAGSSSTRCGRHSFELFNDIPLKAEHCENASLIVHYFRQWIYVHALQLQSK
nr:uncharacterized protein LOC112279849 [Physcomitrium patens]|eukprot:XP_024370352.1 uncharacterized protein LOC112279849 [Physcomitrella patens]